MNPEPLIKLALASDYQDCKEKLIKLKSVFHRNSADYFDSVLCKDEQSLGFAESAVGIFLMSELLQQLEIKPCNTEIIRNADGRPFIRGSKADFSISHSCGLVACAAVKEGSVGCDIQAAKPMPEQKRDRFAGLFMNERELEAYNAASDKDGYYYSLWTKKEACIKCSGGRVWDDLRKLTVPEGVLTGSCENGFWSVCTVKESVFI